jgi:hypothetical protein
MQAASRAAPPAGHCHGRVPRCLAGVTTECLLSRTRNHASCLGHAHRLTDATEFPFGYGANDQPADQDRRQIGGYRTSTAEEAGHGA